MRVRNVSGRGRGVVPAEGPEFFVDGDETVDVDARLGHSLCAQPGNWQEVAETTTETEEES